MAESQPKPKKRRRWGRRLFILIVFIAAASVLALYFSPNRTIGFVAARYLESQGLTPASFDIQDVGFTRASVENIRLGPGPDLSIDRLDLSYSLADLIGGRVDEIAMDGVRAAATVGDLTSANSIAESFSLGVLDRVISDLLSAEPSREDLPRVGLTHGSFHLQTPSGDADASFEVLLSNLGIDTVSLQLDQENISPPQGQLDIEEFRISFDRRQEALRGDLAIKLTAFEGADYRLEDATLTASIGGAEASPDLVQHLEDHLIMKGLYPTFFKAV